MNFLAICGAVVSVVLMLVLLIEGISKRNFLYSLAACVPGITLYYFVTHSNLILLIQLAITG
jgi:hypothetical protein